MWPTLMNFLQTLMFANDTKQLLIHLSHVFIASAIIIIILTIAGYNPTEFYGRFDKSTSWKVPASVAWFIQEIPSFLVPFCLVLLAVCPTHTLNVIISGMFMLHYLHRSVIYPFVRKGKAMRIITTIAGFSFCFLNGILQGYGVICFSSYPHNYHFNPRFILGLIIFAIGMYINISSDYRLANLRKPGETGYKIPTGGLFEYVSCAHFFGEITEWWGYALAANCYPATSFAIFSTLYLSTHAFRHHRFYQEKFKNYPAGRKAVIPFVF